MTAILKLSILSFLFADDPEKIARSFVLIAITYSFVERVGDGLVGSTHVKFLASSLLPLPFQ